MVSFFSRLRLNLCRQLVQSFEVQLVQLFQSCHPLKVKLLQSARKIVQFFRLFSGEAFKRTARSAFQRLIISLFSQLLQLVQSFEVKLVEPGRL